MGDLNDEDCKYDALSYEWGDSTSTTFSIVVDGVEVSVRENLWWALWYLRQADKVRVMWIDALCIDQNNLKERNHQVCLNAEYCPFSVVEERLRIVGVSDGESL